MTTIGKFICTLIMITSFAACTKNELNISQATLLDESKAQADVGPSVNANNSTR